MMWQEGERVSFDANFALGLSSLLAELGVSDIYLSLGYPLMVRYQGEVRQVAWVLDDALKNGHTGLSPQELEPLIGQLKNAEASVQLAYGFISYIAKNLWNLQKVDPGYLVPLFEKRAIDIGMSLYRGYRGRVHAFFSQLQHVQGADEGTVGLEALTEERWHALAPYLRYVIRIIPPLPSTIDELGLPPPLEQQFLSQRGLYLIVGPTASGKTTTAAYLVQSVVGRKPWHILTIEDPIEYIIRANPALGDLAIVHQRERGKDYVTFSEAMRQALRESPDLIFVGEIRDLETLNWTLFLAEAGFTVIATYHTSSFTETVQRILGSFPPEQRELTARRLATVLRAVVAQRLIKGKTALRLFYEYVPIGADLARSIADGNLKEYTTEHSWESSIAYWQARGEITPEEAIRIKAMVQGRTPLASGGRESPYGGGKLFGKS